MKLSEMSTDQLANALIDLAEPVANICQDDVIIDFLKKYANSRNVPMLRLVGDALIALVPTLLKDHRRDFYLTLAVLTGKTPQQIASQRGMTTIEDIRACWDGDLLNFFSLSVGTVHEK